MSESIKPPTYQRQHLLLYFLEYAKGELSKTDLQKLLLLYCEERQLKHYSFVPYKYGGFSFQCRADIIRLEKSEWIAVKNDNMLLLNKKISHEIWAIQSEERKLVREWMKGQLLRGEKLIAQTYRQHPYYALNSKVKNKLLNRKELVAVKNSIGKVKDNEPMVFTLGYEGIDFETFLNKLIKNHVAVLCDVRSNPLSRKLGFSINALSEVLPNLNIEYEHFPGLGVASGKRRNLNSQAGYFDLFSEYRSSLRGKRKDLRRLGDVIESKRRVALTCFEADYHCCHRHCISDFLEKRRQHRVTHL